MPTESPARCSGRSRKPIAGAAGRSNTTSSTGLRRAAFRSRLPTLWKVPGPPRRCPVPQQPTLLADGGVENFNSAVDQLVESGLLKRLLAQTEITFSNSLIESWWRALKHQWLYLNTLDTVSTLEKLIGFYVNEHNTRLPHSAFQGQTPDEMYLGTGSHIPEMLEAARKAARQSRQEANRKATCSKCEQFASISL